MSRLIWRDKALKDVQRLYRFIAKDNQPAAERAVKAIQTSVQLLKTHPQAGKSVLDMGDNFHQWAITFGHAGYLVLYSVHPDEIVIHAVRHQKEVGFT